MYLSEKIKEKALQDFSLPASTFISCGELAYLNLEEQTLFFQKAKNNYKYIICIDLLCLERNIYFFPVWYYGLLVSRKIGKEKYKNFMKEGALMGFFHKQLGIHNLHVIHSAGGAVGAALIKFQ